MAIQRSYLHKNYLRRKSTGQMNPVTHGKPSSEQPMSSNINNTKDLNRWEMFRKNISFLKTTVESSPAISKEQLPKV